MQFNLCRKLCTEYGFSYMGNFCVGSVSSKDCLGRRQSYADHLAQRDLHHIFDLIYDPNTHDEKTRAQQLFRRLVKDFAELGYGEYRTHLFLMDQVAATYGANNQIQLRFQEAIKDALDPNGILAPGKRCVAVVSLRCAAFASQRLTLFPIAAESGPSAIEISQGFVWVSRPRTARRRSCGRRRSPHGCKNESGW